MLTNVINMTTTAAAGSSRRGDVTRAPHKVVIVNGGDDVLDLLETLLDAGHYDVVFVESAAHAYSQVRKVQPDLVILCLDMDDADSFRVLSMLKLDPDTRSVPLLTYATGQGREPEERVDPADDAVFTPRAVARMN